MDHPNLVERIRSGPDSSLQMQPGHDNVESLMTQYMNVDMTEESATFSVAEPVVETDEEYEVTTPKSCQNVGSSTRVDHRRDTSRPVQIRETLIRAEKRHRHEHNPNFPRYPIINPFWTGEALMMRPLYPFVPSTCDMSNDEDNLDDVIGIEEVDQTEGEHRRHGSEVGLPANAREPIDNAHELAAAAQNEQLIEDDHISSAID